MKYLMNMAVVAGALVWFAMAPINLKAQTPSTKVPRMADGHPDLSGVWWRGGDIGGRGLSLAPPGGRGAPRPPAYNSLYQQWAAEKAKTLGDKDDPSLRCIPTSFGTLNVSLFGIGAVGQIIQSPKVVVLLTET